MLYAIKNDAGLVRDTHGHILKFKYEKVAREFAINFTDLSLNPEIVISEGMLTKSELEREMREWLLECFSNPVCQDEIEELSFNELLIAVEAHYDGGIMQFLRDGVPV